MINGLKLKSKFDSIQLLTISATMVVIVIIIVLNNLVFRNYHSQQLELQQQYILTTVKSATNALQLYYDEKMRIFSLYFQDEITSKIAKNYAYAQDDIVSVSFIDKSGQVYYQQGSQNQPFVLQAVSGYKGEILVPPIMTSQGRYTHFMVNEVANSDSTAYVVVGIDIQRIYEKFLASIEIGSYGYSMVKNYDGTILMHPTSNQIGLSSVDGRKKFYEEYDLDYSDLADLLAEQQVNTEGSRVVNSYWWEEDGKPEFTRKIVAYKQVPIGDEIWIINGTLDYSEIEKPLQETQTLINSVTIISILVVITLLFAIVRYRTRNKAIIIEMHQDKMQALGIMSSKVAHELGNFLTPIMIYCDLLKESDNEDAKTFAVRIKASAEKAKSLTGELLRYGRLEEHFTPQEEVVMGKEIQKSLEIIREILPEKIALVEEIDLNDNTTISLKEGLVHQILYNLCINAIHVMEEGTITVSARKVKKGRVHYYQINVADNGPGIAKEDIEKIFMPFYTTKESGQGTGLGLSIVQDLVKKSSGKIIVKSEISLGTEFCIELPIIS